MILFSTLLLMKSFLSRYSSLGGNLFDLKFMFETSTVWLLDSPRSGVYYIARLGVDHHRCVESGIWLGGLVFSPRWKTTVVVCRFHHIRGRLVPCRFALPASVTKNMQRFFLFLEFDAMPCILFYSIPFYEKSKWSLAVDSSYAIYACIAGFLAPVPAAWCHSGFSMRLFFLFLFFISPWKTTLIPKWRRLFQLPRISLSIPFSTVATPPQPWKRLGQWTSNNYTWPDSVVRHTFQQPPFLFYLVHNIISFSPRAYFSMGVHWVVGVVFLYSRLLLFIPLSMCMHSAADCLIVRIASMKHWKWSLFPQ